MHVDRIVLIGASAGGSDTCTRSWRLSSDFSTSIGVCQSLAAHVRTCPNESHSSGRNGVLAARREAQRSPGARSLSHQILPGTGFP